MRFLLGGHSADMQGDARGIGLLRVGEADSPLPGGPLAFEGEAVRTEGSPSWLARHPTLDVVYAALEGAGTVQAFRRSGGARLVRSGAPVALGDRPRHLVVAPDGSSLVASCRDDGRVVRVRLDTEGRLGSEVAAAAPARDPYADLDERDWQTAVLDPERGRGRADAAGADPDGDGAPLHELAAAADALREAAGAAFAHLIPSYEAPPPAATTAARVDTDRPARASRPSRSAFLPGGVLAATDEGLDVVRFWRTGPGGSTPLGAVTLPRGTGPGPMVWHPSGHLYVVATVSCEVYVLAPDAAGSWRVVAGAPVAPGAPAGDTAAEVALARDAQFVYITLCGSDTVAALRVGGDGSALSPVALAETGVTGPVHHVVERDTLLVAGRGSGEVAALTLDIRAGAPGKVRSRTTAPSPTCILPLR